MGLWAWFKGLFGKKKDDSAPTSFVFLLRRPRYLDQRIVENAVKKAFGVDLSHHDKDSTEFVVGGDELPTHFVQFQGWMLMVHNFPEPYTDADETGTIPDLRLRKAVADHKAWISVDAMHWPEDSDPYEGIGKLLAEFADEDCLALYAPQFGEMHPWEAEMEEKLKGPSPLDAIRGLSNVPVIEVPDDDPLMVAAVAEARRRWPEFLSAFEQKRGENFSVKGPFREGEECEFMWVMVESIENKVIYGRLGNDPVNLKKIREGSRVRVKLEDLCDWLYMKGDEMKGGFSIKAVDKAAKRKKT